MAKKVEEPVDSNIEKLQLIIDQLTKDNKKLTGENSELISKNQKLQEKVDKITIDLKEQKDKVKELENEISDIESVVKTSGIKQKTEPVNNKYKIDDFVFYEKKYQRTPFRVSRPAGVLNGVNVYRLVSETGSIVEETVKEEDITYNSVKTFERNY